MSEKKTLTLKDRIANAAAEARSVGMTLAQEKASAAYFKTLRLAAPTIIDAGVDIGTPYLYEAFKDRRIVLFDPNPAARGHIATQWPHLLQDFHQVALGDTPGNLELHVADGTSSILERVGGYENEPRYKGKISVDVVTLDSVVEARGYTGPFGLKIDVEGYELKVLAGATNTLKNCEFIIIEAVVRKRYAGAFKVSDLFNVLAKHGFELLAVLNDKPGIQLYYDLLFVRKDHPLIN